MSSILKGIKEFFIETYYEILIRLPVSQSSMEKVILIDENNELVLRYRHLQTIKSDLLVPQYESDHFVEKNRHILYKLKNDLPHRVWNIETLYNPSERTALLYVKAECIYGYPTIFRYYKVTDLTPRSCPTPTRTSSV
jgi:hypothetical protein